MSETELRLEACKWLKRHYPSRTYRVEPIVFHGINMTITEFLRKKFTGNDIVCIPRYNELAIRPDIISVIEFPPEHILGWIIGECKVGRVSVADFGQAVRYANAAEAYEAYLFYDGTLSKEVLDSISAGGHLYSGTNKWGKTVKKRLLFVEYKDNRLIKKSF